MNLYNLLVQLMFISTMPISVRPIRWTNRIQQIQTKTYQWDGFSVTRVIADNLSTVDHYLIPQQCAICTCPHTQ